MNTQTKTSTAMQSVYPWLRYNDAKAAMAWLTAALGFQEHEVCPGDNDSIAHAELKIGSNLIMLASMKQGEARRTPEAGEATSGIYIALETAADVDACHARAKAAGADIVREICDTEYGSHEFSVRDLEGHRWSFGTYRPQAVVV
jgi:uncharacterized glyoxalase superfamily protein PhnB